MIKLIQFPYPKGRFSFSPFCLKLESYLKLTNTSYENKFTVKPNQFSKQKLPVIQDGEKLIEDSHFIIQYLKETYNIDLDKHLNSEQKAISTAFQVLCEKNIVDITMYFRWCHKQNWPKFREIIFRGAPWLIKASIANGMAKSIQKTLYKSGIGRFTEEEMLILLKQYVKAISDFLADKEFFFGNQVSSIDCIIFASLLQVDQSEIVPQFQNFIDAHPNLRAYLKRMEQKIA